MRFFELAAPKTVSKKILGKSISGVSILLEGTSLNSSESIGTYNHTVGVISLQNIDSPFSSLI